MQPVKFVDSPEFHRSSLRSLIEAPMPDRASWLAARGKRRAPPGTPPELAESYRWPLLSAAQEQHLFRQMNYHKYHVNVILERHRLAGTEVTDDQEFTRHQDGAHQTRTALFNCNTRLVVSIAKHRANANTFLDVISDGNMALLNAVDNFNYYLRRPNKTTGKVSRIKFSTYAGYAIARGLASAYRASQRIDGRFLTSMDGALGCLPDDQPDPEESRNANATRAAMISGLNEFLDDRERLVMERRHGLADASPTGREIWTLSEIGDQFGLTRERIRQIARGALARLRAGLFNQHPELFNTPVGPTKVR